jgi:hypothetical protein
MKVKTMCYNKSLLEILSHILTNRNIQILRKNRWLPHLLTQDNSKRIVIPIDKFTPLIIEQFSLDDTANVNRFKTHYKLLSPTKTKY